MANLIFVASQQKELESEKKTGAKLKELASRREFVSRYGDGKSLTANRIFQQQILRFSENREKQLEKMEKIFQDERDSKKRQKMALNKKKDDEIEMIESQERKREIVVEDKKHRDVDFNS